MLQNIGLILAGLAILIVGAQLLVKGASRLALALGMAATSTTCSSSWECVRRLRRWRSRHSSSGWMFQS
jgi:hypothetical protein